MSQTSIVLVHAHELFRGGVRGYLATQSDFKILGEASNGQQAIQLVDYTSPHIVLMDIDLPGINGMEVARAMKRSHPEVGIILMNATVDGQLVVRAIRAGVSAFVLRTISGEGLIHEIRRVRRGEYPINELVLSQADVASQVLEAFRQIGIEDNGQAIYSPLSPRELQVLDLIASGRSNKEIAVHLDISNQTVKNHVSSILRKLAVNDRTHAVVYAMKRGWINVTLPGEQ